MSNLTLALDNDLLHRCRVHAATRRTTVNALVRDYLTRLVAQTSDEQAERAAEAAKWHALWNDIDSELPTDTKSKRSRLTRDEIYSGEPRFDRWNAR